ncbi:unnamed protein product [Alternaria alternata]
MSSPTDATKTQPWKKWLAEEIDARKRAENGVSEADQQDAQRRLYEANDENKNCRGPNNKTG